MNIFLTILVIIVALIGLILLIALFVRKSYTVQREISIDRPANEIFSYIRLLKNQDQYSKWVMTDPNMKKTFTGTEGTVGFIYAWDGNKQAGQGEQEIKRIEEGKRLDVEVRFIRPFAGVGQIPMILEEQLPNQTKVTWGMSSAMNYPMNIMLLIMDINKLVGKDLEISLANLKNVMEAK